VDWGGEANTMMRDGQRHKPKPPPERRAAELLALAVGMLDEACATAEPGARRLRLVDVEMVALAVANACRKAARG
jgi:hypothetical protein